MAGEKGKKIGFKSSDYISDNVDSKFFNRLNREDITMNNGFLERPLTTLKYSNFLIIYDQFIQTHKQITDNQITQMLTKIDQNTQEFIKSYEKKWGIDDVKESKQVCLSFC